jgi:hypothetical protein
MMRDQIEHNEHRRPADDGREPVAWAGREQPTPAPAHPAAREQP